MHAFRCSVVVQFVNIIRSLRIVQWSNKLQLPPQIRNVGPFYDLFLFIHASRLCSPSFGSLGVISNELEREECSWVSTAFVLDFDTGNMTSFANKTHAIFHWRIDCLSYKYPNLLTTPHFSSFCQDVKAQGRQRHNKL